MEINEENIKIIKEIFSRKPLVILKKRESYALYESGFFGNKPRTWNSYEEIMSDNYRGDFTIRSKSRGLREETSKYNIPKKQLAKEIRELEKLGIDMSNIVFNESMPDDFIKIQGEVTRLYEGLHFHYSLLKTQMNTALREYPLNAKGLKAKMLLQENMSQVSYLNLEILLDAFPKSVIEFSTWSKNVGDKKEDTIIWELRNY
jgi:hypothetical protein